MGLNLYYHIDQFFLQFWMELYILTHTSNAKCFRNVTLINIQCFAEIIVPARGYDSHSPNQV